jgi:uncharacterized protein (DUF305 family)
MMKMIKRMAGVAALALIAGCSNSESNNAEQAAAEATPTAAAPAADPSNPFGQAEVTMNERMMGAVGVSAADNWVRKMVEHHRGAVEMSQILLQQVSTGHVADMARTTVEKQNKEIADLQKMIQQGQSDQQSAALYQPSMQQMHQAMMAAKGADISETWTRKMLEHHRGAVAMSDALLQRGNPTPDVRRAAEKTKSDQQKEIEMLERMLRGQPMQSPVQRSTTPATSATNKTAPTKNTPAVKSTSAPAPGAPSKKAAPSTAQPPSDPHAGHDMSKM